MANKVRFGLSNTKYAIWDEKTQKYGTPVDFPGAVSLSLSREGGDSSDFYADNGVYYTFAGTNGGYSADLEMAMVTDKVRQDLLGEIVDATNHVQYEVGDAEPAQFALITQMEGNSGPVAFVFFGCKASRVELSANTKNDSPDVDTDTLNVRIAGETLTVKGEQKNVIQGHLEKTADNATEFAAFFTTVQVPTAEAA